MGERLKKREKTKLGGEGRREGNLGGTGGDKNHDQNILHEKEIFNYKEKTNYF